MPVVTHKYTGADDTTVVVDDWLVMEQQQVPQSQQICTVDDLQKMFGHAMTEQSVKSYVSDQCPVKRRVVNGKIVISCDLTILVHRSKGLKNQNYDMTPSEGRLSGGVTVVRQVRRPYKLDRDGILFLEWLPAVQPSVGWLTKIFDNDKNRVFIPGIPDSVNGYLYWDQAYKAELEVSGTAIIDRYTLTIDHQQGYKFDKTILLTAEWGAADADGNRKSATLEAKPPQCWIDEANKCAPDDLFGGDGDDDGDADWDFTLNAGYWRVYVGFCSGEIKDKERVV
jgi:hypothetical protein